MSRGKRSDFEMIHGEGILRVSNENQAKREKNLTLKHKKERARERQNVFGEGNGKMCDLKYKNSRDLELNWRNATTTTTSTPNEQRLIRME